MNKNFQSFWLYWLVSLVLFHALVFLPPAEIFGVARYTRPAFWIAYAMILVSLILLLLCGVLALRGDKESIFLRLPILKTGFGFVTLAVILGAPFLIFPVLPAWIGGMLSVIVSFLFAVGVLKASAAAENAEAVGQKTERKTAFIRSLVASAQTLKENAKDKTAEAAAGRVYEALRYSDPVSDPALNDVEEEIFDTFNRFEEAVSRSDGAAVALLSEKLLALINERNRKCKLLKA